MVQRLTGLAAATMSPIALVATTATVSLAVLIGCDDNDVRAYRAPKDPAPVSRITQETTKREMSWTVPATWQRDATPATAMAVATFTSTDASRPPLQINVSMFPGDAGGVLENINRWRTQLGLTKITDSDIRAAIASFNGDGISGFTMTLTADKPADANAPTRAMFGAMIATQDGNTWFVKASAAEPVIAAHRDDLIAFAQSFHLDAADDGHGHDHAHDEHAHDEAAADTTTESSMTDVTPTTQPSRGTDFRPGDIPSTWQRESKASSILSAAYTVGDGENAARITVTPLLGDGGGLIPNVNIWRENVNLPPISDPFEQPVSEVTVGDAKSILVDLSDPATPSPRRLIVIVVQQPGRTWFFKIAGQPATVEREREAFVKFVQSSTFNAERP